MARPSCGAAATTMVRESRPPRSVSRSAKSAAAWSSRVASPERSKPCGMPRSALPSVESSDGVGSNPMATGRPVALINSTALAKVSVAAASLKPFTCVTLWPINGSALPLGVAVTTGSSLGFSAAMSPSPSFTSGNTTSYVPSLAAPVDMSPATTGEATANTAEAAGMLGAAVPRLDTSPVAGMNPRVRGLPAAEMSSIARA
mmetsp:Transcript_70465/g.159376  ORF Transcript_70465/g.159376 Transcript_70465/m.159376 type:complete len:202 (+) Transcript_70465:1711-2316(+)